MTLQKKQTSPPLVTPECTKIDWQVIFKTDSPATEGVTNHEILDAVNKVIAHHHFCFLATWLSKQGNIILETPPNVSADTGASFTIEITTALDSLNIVVDSIYANSHWAQYVIQEVPCKRLFYFGYEEVGSDSKA